MPEAARARWYSRPAKSSKSQPFAIVTHRPVRRERARLLGDRLRDGRRSRRPARATSCATPRSPFSFARTAEPLARRCGCATSESRRSATQRTPVARFTAAPTRWTEPGGEVVSTTSIPSRAHDPDRGRDRGRVPGHVLVGDEQRGGRRADACAPSALEPVRAVQLLRRSPAARADVARAVHPGLRRRRQLVVACTHFGSSGASTCVSMPSGGQVGRELERPLHAAAARGREVERDEQEPFMGGRGCSGVR